MKSDSGVLAGAFTSWLGSLSGCCGMSRTVPKPRDGYAEKEPVVVLRNQPTYVAPPSADPLIRPDTRCSRRERGPRMSFSSGRSFFSGRRRFSNEPSRRPQISAPTNFRHVHSESFQYPSGPRQAPQPRPRSFRPIELSIYMPNNQLSPLMHHFAEEDVPGLARPAPVVTRSHSQSSQGSSATLVHQRSYSSMSFHLPRRPVAANYTSSSSSAVDSSAVDDDLVPPIPPRSRRRAYTAPSVELIAERIASARIEMEMLQEEINSIVERQSIYSRPSTAYGMADLEPMPSIPAMPAAAPSFAERVSTERPQTAPPTHLFREQRGPNPLAQHPSGLSIPQSAPSLSGSDTSPLRPPLPLIFRPPLRKKKSFSRVSNWVLGAAPHERSVSVDSITNEPRPIRGNEGFYQVASPPLVTGRSSFDTATTKSDWEESDGEEEEERTAQSTCWSPESSPAARQEENKTDLTRLGTFGRGQSGPRPQSVGVAF